MTDYQPPVSELLTIGETSSANRWTDYQQFGIAVQHIPELLQMMCDTQLSYNSHGTSAWGPVHAWRTLAMLRAREVVEPLLEMMELWQVQSNSIHEEELPLVLSMIGPDAIEPLAMYCRNSIQKLTPKMIAATGLLQISMAYPESRPRCVGIFRELMLFSKSTDPDFHKMLETALTDQLEEQPHEDYLRQSIETKITSIQIEDYAQSLEVQKNLNSNLLANSASDPQTDDPYLADAKTMIKPSINLEEKPNGGFADAKTMIKSSEEIRIPDLDFADAKTVIRKTSEFISPLNQTQAKLVLIGETGATDIDLSQVPMIFGRGSKNDFIVSDIATSRQHFQIKREGDGFQVVDLDSGNGTFLNSTRIKEADLRQGDYIEIGTTRFEFKFTSDHGISFGNLPRHIITHPKGGVPESQKKGKDIAKQKAIHNQSPVTVLPEDTNISKIPKQKTNYTPIIALVLGTISLLFAGLLVFQYLKKSDNPETPQATQETNADKDKAMEHYVTGSQLIQIEKWEEARKQFLLAQYLDPELTDAQTNLDKIENEIRMRNKIQAAQKLSSNGKYKEALEELKDFSPESNYHFNVTNEMIPDFKQRYAENLHIKASQAYSKGELDQAQELISLAISYQPANSDFLLLNTWIEEKKKNPNSIQHPPSETLLAVNTNTDPTEPNESVPTKKTEKKSNPKENKTTSPNKEKTKTKAKTKAKKTTPKTETKIDFKQGFTLYKKGNFKEAIAFFQNLSSNQDSSISTRSTAFVKNIKLFQIEYQEGVKAMKAKNYKVATTHLETAMKIDGKLGAYYTPQIRYYIGNAYYQQAHQNFKSKSYTSSATLTQKSLKYTPKHKGSQDLLTKLDDQAKTLVEEAEALKESNPEKAKKLCNQAMKMAKKNKSTYQKASNLLKTL